MILHFGKMGNQPSTGLTAALKVGETVFPNLNSKLNPIKFPTTASMLTDDVLHQFAFDAGEDCFNNNVSSVLGPKNQSQEIENPHNIFNHKPHPYLRSSSESVKPNNTLQFGDPRRENGGPQKHETVQITDQKSPEVSNSKNHKLETNNKLQYKPKIENDVKRNVSKTANIPSLVMAAGSSKTTCQLVQDLKEWKFAKSKLLELPIDEEKNNYLRRNNRGCLFSQVSPTQLKSPTVISFSKDVLINILNMDPNITKSQEFADFIAGNSILENSIPLAHRYGGHQFGYWAMQLGDGRAILLGEFINSAGERWELQLKGSGRTPYSRDGDGRAVLRSSIREFLCSEAMHYLGIPTSRAGAIVVSDERAFRDPMYDGNPVMERTAVVLRLAPTWFRFGSFELPMKTGELDLLKKLFDFILKEHFPDIDPSSDDAVLTLLSRVSRLTTDLVVAWQAVGFTHGVLNTDNMSVLGVTIDYGPFGFVEAYDPEYVPNASDHEARYCYIRQPSIIMYNLMKLTEALFPLMSEPQKKQTSDLLQAEALYLTDSLVDTFSKKLGLAKADKMLVEMFTEMLEETQADFTMSFRELSEIELGQVDRPCPGTYWALATVAQHKRYPEFVALYKERLKAAGVTDEERRKQMCQKNPRYVLRNWMAQLAIKEAEEDNFAEVERLLRILSSPFTRQEEAEQMGFAKPPPGWASKLRLSCSS